MKDFINGTSYRSGMICKTVLVLLRRLLGSEAVFLRIMALKPSILDALQNLGFKSKHCTTKYNISGISERGIISSMRIY